MPFQTRRCRIDATKRRTFTALGIGLIVVLSLLLATLFVLSNLGAGPSATVFVSQGTPANGIDAVANQFLADLKEGRVDAAYRQTGSAFQERLSLAQFQALMQKYPFPRPPGSQMGTQKHDAARGVYVYEFRYIGANGQIAFTFEVGKDNDTFRVVSFAMQQGAG